MSSTVQRISLQRNFLWILLGNTVYAGCQWGMLIVLAKLGNPEMVGRFALGMAVAAPVMMFTSLQLRTIQATDVRNEYEFRDYLTLQAITTVFALVVICGTVILTGYRGETALVILAAGLAKAVESMSDVFYGLFQKHEQMARIAKSMMSKGPLSLLAFIIGIYISGEVVWGLIALAAAWGIVLLMYDLPNGMSLLRISLVSPNDRTGEQGKRHISLHLCSDRTILGRLAWTGLPLGLAVGMNSLTPNIPRYFIDSFWGERTLGFFAAVAVFMRLGFYLEWALGQSALPRLSRLVSQGEMRHFVLLLCKLIGFGIVVGIAGLLVAVVFGQQILTLFYGPEYASHSKTLAYIMLAAGMGYVGGFLKTGTDAARCFFLQLPLFALVTLISALASFLLIPGHGLLGAAFSLVITKVTLVFGYAVVLNCAVKKVADRQINDTIY